MARIISQHREPVWEITGRRLLRRAVVTERVTIEFSHKPGDEDHSLVRQLLPSLSPQWTDRFWKFKVEEQAGLNTLRVSFWGWRREKACQQFVNALKVYRTANKETA